MYWPPTCIRTPRDVPLGGPIGHGPQPPCHLVSDAHEWINEIPTVSSETTAKGTGLAESAGKEDPVELDSSLTL
jgi:hypothetical protein